MDMIGRTVLITGGGVEEWQLTGDVVNTAARLQSLASPQSVLVGAETALLVPLRYRSRPLGVLCAFDRLEEPPEFGDCPR